MAAAAARGRTRKCVEVEARKLDGANTLFTLGTIQRITCDDRSRRSSSSSYTTDQSERIYPHSTAIPDLETSIVVEMQKEGFACLLCFEGGSSGGTALRAAVLRPSVKGVGSKQPLSAKRPTTDYPSTTMGSFVNYLALLYTTVAMTTSENEYLITFLKEIRGRYATTAATTMYSQMAVRRSSLLSLLEKSLCSFLLLFLLILILCFFTSPPFFASVPF